MNQPAENPHGLIHGGTVLVVEEDLEHQESVRRIIEGIGYSVQTCNSYVEGIRQLVSGAFEIVVVSQGSRNFEGRCVLEAATEFNRRLPVVVVARHLEMACYLDAMQLGAVDYVAGPFGVEEIARVMRTHGPRRKAGVEAEGSISLPTPARLAT